jgi:CRISPR system Cascade subunit CasD
MSGEQATLVLRLAGPLQAWGRPSEGNRREVADAPSKAGIVGLLAAAWGLRRWDSIEQLVDLQLGVRVDRPGTLLRDYHTVSEHMPDLPLRSAAVDARGRQKRTSPKKTTGVTQRFYLQDAVFVAAVQGAESLVVTLGQAIRHPAFPLALGRRSCVPTQPLLLPAPDGGIVWPAAPLTEVLASVPWQGRSRQWGNVRHATGFAGNPRQAEAKNEIRLPVIVDADNPAAPDVESVNDVPVTFSLRDRAFVYRNVRHTWVSIPVDHEATQAVHGFAYLGGN